MRMTPFCNWSFGSAGRLKQSRVDKGFVHSSGVLHPRSSIRTLCTSIPTSTFSIAVFEASSAFLVVTGIPKPASTVHRQVLVQRTSPRSEPNNPSDQRSISFSPCVASLLAVIEKLPLGRCLDFLSCWSPETQRVQDDILSALDLSLQLSPPQAHLRRTLGGSS